MKIMAMFSPRFAAWIVSAVPMAAFGIEAFGACGHGGCTSVGRFDPVDVNVIVGEYGASYGCHANTIVFLAHFFDYLGNEFVDHAVGASRAVVHGAVVEKFGFGVNLILGSDYIFGFHLDLVLLIV